MNYVYDNPIIDAIRSFENQIQYIFILNGVYDILCSLSILDIIWIPVLDKLHLSMMKRFDSGKQEFKLFISFWILTLGIMRLSGNYFMITLSYFIETMFYLYEYFIKESVYKYKTLFVVVISFILGMFSYILNISR